MRKIHLLVILVFTVSSLSGCARMNKTKRAESLSTSMKVSEQPTLYDNLVFQSRGAAMRGPVSRGGMMPFTGTAISLASDAVKNFIAKENARYTDTYTQAQSDLFFYRETSDSHPLDPLGMQFKGVEVVRSKQSDTLFYASFEIDTSRTFEILNNSIFRLRLSELEVKGTDIPSNKRWFFPWTWFERPSKTVNYDVNIKVFASWIDEDVVMHKNKIVGEFFLSLRDAPIKGDPDYSDFIANNLGQELSGYSYLIPRSVSFQQVAGSAEKLYGHGLYSIQVEVTESRKKGRLTDTATNIIQDVEVSEEGIQGF